MKNPVHRDNLLTITGLAVLSTVFILGVFLPTHNSVVCVRQDIAAAEKLIREIPARLIELETLQGEVEARVCYLEGSKHLLTSSSGSHEMIREVARLGKASGLEITRLEPAARTEGKTYQAMPFRLGFRGPYRGLARFSCGLEKLPRLVVVEDIRLVCENERARGEVQGDLHFSIYEGNSDFFEFNENRRSAAQSAADKDFQ